MRGTPTFLITAALLGLAQAAVAQTPAASQANARAQSGAASQAAAGVGSNSTPGTLSAADQKFLQDAAQGDVYEISLARLAIQKGSRPEIKQVAQAIIRDHDQISAGLAHLAQVKSVTLPKAIKPDDKAKLDKLQKLNGPAFDQAFKTEMLHINAEDKQTLDRQIASTQDNDVKAFAGQMQTADANHERLTQGL